VVGRTDIRTFSRLFITAVSVSAAISACFPIYFPFIHFDFSNRAHRQTDRLASWRLNVLKGSFGSADGLEMQLAQLQTPQQQPVVQYNFDFSPTIKRRSPFGDRESAFVQSCSSQISPFGSSNQCCILAKH
jgi:hypothetical protein